jgi:hypothetical protein
MAVLDARRAVRNCAGTNLFLLLVFFIKEGDVELVDLQFPGSILW